MGICGTNTNKRKEYILINEDNKNNKSNKRTEKRNKKNRVKESKLNSLPFEKISDDLSNISKSICKIKIETKLERIIGTEIFVKI